MWIGGAGVRHRGHRKRGGGCGCELSTQAGFRNYLVLIRLYEWVSKVLGVCCPCGRERRAGVGGAKIEPRATGIALILVRSSKEMQRRRLLEEMRILANVRWREILMSTRINGGASRVTLSSNTCKIHMLTCTCTEAPGLGKRRSRPAKGFGLSVLIKVKNEAQRESKIYGKAGQCSMRRRFSKRKWKVPMPPGLFPVFLRLVLHGSRDGQCCSVHSVLLPLSFASESAALAPSQARCGFRVLLFSPRSHFPCISAPLLGPGTASIASKSNFFPFRSNPDFIFVFFPSKIERPPCGVGFPKWGFFG